MGRKRLGVLIGQSDENMQNLFLQGFMQEAYTLDYDVCVFSMQQKYQEAATRDVGDSSVFDLLNLSMFAGIIFLKDTIQSTNGCADMLEEKLHNEFDGPVLVIDRDSKYFETINVDHRTPMRKLVDHLIDVHGYKNIIFLNGKINHPHSIQRLEGYKDSMRAHGLEVTDAMIYHGDYWYDSGDFMVDELVKRPEGLPDAIACANDCMAIGVCDKLSSYGYSIPDDIAVIGYDSIDEGRLSPVPLTSAFIPAKSCGLYAAKRIHALISGENTEKFETEFDMFEGNSCGCDHKVEQITLRRTQWGTDLSKVGFNSCFNHIMEDLLSQNEEKEFFYMVLKYVYQIRDFEYFSLCLNDDWNDSSRIINKKAKQSGNLTKKIFRIINCGKDKESDTLSFNDAFNREDKLPELEIEREKPTTYFYVPLFFEDRAFGYASICYGDEIKTYDETFRLWVRAIGQCYEAFHRQNALRDMIEKMEASQIRDSLTGMHNYRGFIKKSKELDAVGRLEGRIIIITAVDLNRLKEINSGYGRGEGDEAICTLANIISDVVVRGEIAARMGNDEFVIASVVKDIDSVHGEELIASIQEQIDAYNTTGEKPYRLEVSCGTMIRVVSDVEDLEHLVNDTVSLKNGIKQETMRLREENKLLSPEDIENDEIVRDILDNNRLIYFFQPIVSAKTGEIYAYEALMRANVEKRLSPPVIIQSAERMGRLYDIERYTFFNVAKYVSEHEEQFEGKKVFVNSIPGCRLTQEDSRILNSMIEQYGGSIVVEFTEEAELDDASLAEIKENFASMNIETAIDDYGSGYSNVNNLLRYMPRYVKIDRMLITEIQDNLQKQHFVRDIIEFAHDNDIIALAEGVETTHEMQKVIQLGVDLIQGYYTAKPDGNPIDAINGNVAAEIVQYSQSDAFRHEKKEIIVEENKTLSTIQLAMNKYTDILASRDMNRLEINGKNGFDSNLVLKIEDGFTGEIVLDNVSFAGDKFASCMTLGENCNVTLELIGENRMRTGGICVPESSTLKIIGEGSLYIIINNGKYFGIGNDYNSRHGKLIFEQDGFIFINASGMKGVGIGSGLGGEIVINKGGYDFEINGQEGVAIGAIDADVDIKINSCDMNLKYGVSNSVIIGSMKKNADIFVENSSIRIQGSSNNITGIGTLLGEKVNVVLSNGYFSMGLIGSTECYGIGGCDATTSCDIRFARYEAKLQGKRSLIIGDFNKTSKFTAYNSAVTCSIMNNNNEDLGVLPENMKFINGTLEFNLNGEAIDRVAEIGEL